MLGAVRLQLECPEISPLDDADDVRKKYERIPDYHAVYVITANGNPCKVGYTNDPQCRIVTLQQSTPNTLRLAFALWFETQHIAYKLEKATHRRLKAKKVRGEWFAVEPNEAIDALAHCVADAKVPFIGHVDMMAFKETARHTVYKALSERKDKLHRWVAAKPDSVTDDGVFRYLVRDSIKVIEEV